MSTCPPGAARAVRHGVLAGLAVLAVLVGLDRGAPDVPNPLSAVVSLLVVLAPGEPVHEDYEVDVAPAAGACADAPREPILGTDQGIVIGETDAC